MSVQEVSPQKSFHARPGLLAIPRISLFTSGRNSSNSNDSTELSSPLLPKNPWATSKVGLSAKKSKFRELQSEQEDEQQDQVPALNIDVPALIEDSLKPFELSSPLGSSSCGDDSPFRQRAFRKTSPRRQREEEFGAAFYKRIEDFFDSEHLTIIQPEDNRRSMFNSLRVSTARIKSLQNGDPNSAAVSDLNSAGLISPSIETSTLFKRRSSSREPSAERAPQEKKALTKSPFFNFRDQDTPSRNVINLDEAEENPRKKANHRTSGLSSKLQGLSVSTNRGRSDTVRVLDMDEQDANSPSKV